MYTRLGQVRYVDRHTPQHVSKLNNKVNWSSKTTPTINTAIVADVVRQLPLKQKLAGSNPSTSAFQLTVFPKGKDNQWRKRTQRKF